MSQNSHFLDADQGSISPANSPKKAVGLAAKMENPKRVNVLKRLNLNNSKPEAAFTRLAKLARRFLKAPMTTITFLDDQKVYFKAEGNKDILSLEGREMSVKESICQFVMERGEPLILADAREDERIYSLSVVLEEGLVSYMGMPIFSPNGYLLGCFSVMDQKVREWDQGEVGLLKEFTVLVERELASRYDKLNVEESLQASEDRLQKVLGWADCLVWEAEVEVLENDWNWQFKIQPSGLFHRLFGERVPPDNIGLWYRFQIPEQDKMDKLSRESILSGKPGYSQVFRAYHNDQTIWLRESVTISSLGANRYWLVGVATDVTQLKELESSLAEARDQAIDGSRLKSEFLATMSHEIRTPMNGILSMASLLMDTQLDDTQKRMGNVILNSGEALLTIINDILDFSKIEAGKLSVEYESVDIVALMQDIMSLLVSRAEKKGLELLFHMDVRIPRVVMADSTRIRQVLMNLLGNALKFTDTGEVELKVKLLGRENGRTAMRFSVRDTGCGIAENVQKLLFHPFVQADGSAARRHGGTGLGLAISRQLVHLMGGSIHFRSEKGKGSEFWVDLDFESPDMDEPKHTPQAPLLSSELVLVVDDNESNRVYLMGHLKHMGLNAKAVGSASEALDFLNTCDQKGTQVSLAILDLFMPDQSGLDLAELIRDDERFKRLPLMMLASSMPGMESERISKVGFAKVLNKPVNGDVLDKEIRSILDDELSGEGDSGEGSSFKTQPGEGERRIAYTSSGNRARVLMAEDNPSNQVVGEIMLEKLGFDFTIVNNGKEALDALERESYDLVLMDCQMPEMDGYATTRMIRSGEIKGINPRIPIIALTAYAMKGDRARCKEAGMDEYVTKPIRETSLQAAFLHCGIRVGIAGIESESLADENASLLDRSVVDVLRTLRGRKHSCLLGDLLERFVEEDSGNLDRLETLISEKATDQVSQLAHYMAGYYANLGALSGQRALLELEFAARSHEGEVLVQLFGQSRPVLEEIREEIVQLQDTID